MLVLKATASLALALALSLAGAEKVGSPPGTFLVKRWGQTG